jgi:hypothetical protein
MDDNINWKLLFQCHIIIATQHNTDTMATSVTCTCAYTTVATCVYFSYLEHVGSFDGLRATLCMPCHALPCHVCWHTHSRTFVVYPVLEYPFFLQGCVASGIYPLLHVSLSLRVIKAALDKILHSSKALGNHIYLLFWSAQS